MVRGRWCHTHDCPRSRSPFFLRSPSPSLYTYLGFHTNLGPFPGWVEGVCASSPGTTRLAQLCASEHLGSGTALRAVPSMRPTGWGDTWPGFSHGRKAGLCGQGKGGREGLMCFELTARSLGLWRAWLPAWGLFSDGCMWSSQRLGPLQGRGALGHLRGTSYAEY